jgi:hypothetical protein
MTSFRPSPFLGSAVLLVLAGCLTPAGPSGGGASPGANPFVAPAPFAAASGPSSPSGGDTDAAANGMGTENLTAPSPNTSNPSTVEETPVTVVGAPTAKSLFDSPCPTKPFTLCFSNVVVQAIGSEAGTDRVEYQVQGVFDTKDDATSALTPVREGAIYLSQMLADLADGFGRFTVTFFATVGRDVELEGPACHRLTTMGFQTPSPGSPLSLDPCSSSEPTDVSTLPSSRVPGGGLAKPSINPEAITR